MKKLAIFFAIVILIISIITYMYLNYKINYNISKRINLEYEAYLDKEITGIDLISLINKAIDSNNRNEIQRDNKGKYLENETNSIKINIKIIDNGKTYEMETLYNGGIENFIMYYGNIKFKCIEIQYHQSSNKVKYMLFEQITE